MLVSTLFLLHIPVVRNIGRDLASGLSRATHFTGSLFMRNLEKINVSAEEQTTLLSHLEVKL